MNVHAKGMYQLQQNKGLSIRMTHLAPKSFGDSVEEDIVIISTCLPDCETAKPGLLNIFAFGSKRLRVVEGDHHLRGRVVHVRLKPEK